MVKQAKGSSSTEHQVVNPTMENSVDKHSHGPLLTIRDLWVSRGDNMILRGINTTIQRGKITALIGLNGCGKTTLLRTLIREYPYQGEIKFHCGHDHSRHQPNLVGYVPQKLSLEPRYPLTVQELFALALQKRPIFLGIQKSIRERIHYLLQKVGGLKLLHRPVNHISGGELQRVLLALALDPQPELLLLDEPAAGVDFSDQENFYGLLSHLNRDSGLTLLLVSHDLSIVSKHAHHVLCLKNGIIECQGAPESILSKEMLSRTFGGEMTIYQHDHPSSHPAHFHPPHDHSHSHNHSHSHHHSHSHNPSHPHSSTHESSEDSNQSDDATNHSKQDHRHDDQPINPDHAN